MSGRAGFALAAVTSVAGIVLAAAGLVQQPVSLGLAIAGLALMGVAYVLATAAVRC